MPPNGWMAVRQVQQSVPGASMSWKASAEKTRSKTAYKSYCCARDDFGRPIFAIQLIPVWNIQLVRSRAKVPWLLTETARAPSPNLSTSHHLSRLYLVVPIAISVGGGSVLGRAVLPAADSPGPKDRAVEYMVGCKGPPIGSSLSERCPRCRS